MGFPILPGSTGIKPLESFCEVALILKSTAGRDLGNAIGGLLQKQVRPLHHPVLDQILDGGGLDGFLKTAQALPLTDVGRAGDVGQKETAGVVFMEIRQHLFILRLS